MNIIAFIVSLALFVGGLVIMGSAFYAPGVEALVFMLGILSSSLGIIIPVHLLKRIDG